MRRLLTVLLLAPWLVGCQQYWVRGQEKFTIPADDVEAIVCNTHNGDVDIVGDASTPDGHIVIAVEKFASGSSEEEARKNLECVEIVRDIVDGRLKLGWKDSKNRTFRDWSGGASFSVRGPVHLGATIRTHNGSVDVQQCTGAVDIESHNGDIRIAGPYRRVGLETHNGDVTALLNGTDPIAGSIETHNGDVVVSWAESCSATIDASTHNGSLTTAGPVVHVRGKKRWLEARVGDGSGKFSVSTHNGDVCLQGTKD